MLLLFISVTVTSLGMNISGNPNCQNCFENKSLESSIIIESTNSQTIFGKMSQKHAEKTVAKPDKRNLSSENLKNIITLYQTTRITQRNLADQFNISKSSLNRILKANQIAIRKEEKPSKIKYFH